MQPSTNIPWAIPKRNARLLRNLRSISFSEAIGGDCRYDRVVATLVEFVEAWLNQQQPRLAWCVAQESGSRQGHASPAAALRYQHATRQRDQVIADALSTVTTSGSVIPIRRPKKAKTDVARLSHGQPGSHRPTKQKRAVNRDN